MTEKTQIDEYAPRSAPQSEDVGKKDDSWSSFLAWRENFKKSMGHGWRNPPRSTENSENRTSSDKITRTREDSGSSGGGLDAEPAPREDKKKAPAKRKAGHSAPRAGSHDGDGVEPARTKKRGTARKRSGNRKSRTVSKKP